MRFAKLAALLLCCTAFAGRASALEKESGGFAQLTLIGVSGVSPLALGGLGVLSGTPSISLGYRSGQSVFLVGLAVSASKGDLTGTLGGISSAEAVRVTEHQFTGIVSPAVRRYLAPVAADTLLPFAQVGVDFSLTRISLTPSSGDPAVSWQVGGSVSLGGEYIVGNHFGVELRGVLSGGYAWGHTFPGESDQNTVSASLGGAGAINLHW